MKRLQLLMGMPITIEILDASATEAVIEQVFAYFRSIDETFSTYKEESEISKINRGELPEEAYSDAMKTILALSEQTRQETQGYFDIEREPQKGQRQHSRRFRCLPRGSRHLPGPF